MSEHLIGYCAGKLTGLKSEECIYGRVRDLLLEEGVHLYLPGEHTPPEPQQHQHPQHDSEEIFRIDYYRVAYADFVIASLDNPSTGTGMELMIAMEGLVPTFAFHHSELQLEKDVSRMPVGTPILLRFSGTGQLEPLTAIEKILYYDSVEQLVSVVSSQIRAMKEKLSEARELKGRIDHAWLDLDVGHLIRKKQSESGLTDEDLALKLGVSQEMLNRMRITRDQFEKFFRKDCLSLTSKDKLSLIIDPDHVSVVRYINPSVVQLALLSRLLDLDLFRLLAAPLGFRAAPDISEDQVPDECIQSFRILSSIDGAATPESLLLLKHGEMARYYEMSMDSAQINRYKAPDRDEWEKRLRKLRSRKLF